MIVLPEDKNIISLLTAEDSKQLLLALFSEEDDLPEMSPLANMAYTMVKNKSDRISSMKSRAGKQGGAPKGNTNAKKQAEQPTVSESVSVTVTDTVSDTVSVNSSVSTSSAKNVENVENLKLTDRRTDERIKLTNEQEKDLIRRFGKVAFNAALNQWELWLNNNPQITKANDFKGISKILAEDFGEIERIPVSDLTKMGSSTE